MKTIPVEAPGVILREEFIKPLGLTAYQVAKACGVSHPGMSEILRGKRSITAETAFLREFDHAVSVISEAPLRWPVHIENTRRYVFRSFPFSLVYFVEGQTIFVVSLESHSKRPGYWRERLG